MHAQSAWSRAKYVHTPSKTTSNNYSLQFQVRVNQGSIPAAVCGE